SNTDSNDYSILSIYFKIFKNILTPQIFGKFRQHRLCAAQSDKPQLPHRASSNKKKKKCPSTATQLGINLNPNLTIQSILQLPYFNIYHFVGQHFFKYKAQNLQLVFASPPGNSFIIQMAQQDNINIP
ncbi:hypothetical protein RBK84_00230, partial [Pseudomonas aeruginosa]|uniref:hypothetical protein n=1 Tax=Pseudomonas aeruginosa TaxID=287 RepID=UPI0027D3C5B9